MALTFTKETNGNVTVRSGGAVVKCLQPNLHVLCDPKNNGILIISSTPNPYDEAGEFQVEWASITLPTYTDKEDLISKLCDGFFDGERAEVVAALLDSTTSPSTTSNEFIIAKADVNVILLPANVARKQVFIRNTSNRNMFLSFGNLATILSPVVIEPEGVFTDLVFRGVINGIWLTGGTGSASIVEFY